MEKNVECVIYFKEKGRAQDTLFVDYEFMITEFLKHIYNNYQDSWDYIERFDLRQERRLFGKLMNTEETKSKIGRQLVANDFDLNISFNCIIRCEMWLKSDDRPTIYRITKKELLQTFIKDTYNLYGNDWYCFETFFDDTGNHAYGIIYNDTKLKQRQHLTFSALKTRHYKLNREKWKNEKLQ